jgi:ribose transport system substrate-binding protein
MDARSTSRTLRRAFWLCALLAALAVMAVAAGCGDDDDSGSGGADNAAAANGGGDGGSSAALEEARAAVEEATAPVDWQPPGGEVDASKAKGKSVWYVDYDLSIPFEQLLHRGLKEGLGAAGVKLTTVDGKSQVAEFNRGIENAVAQNADAILLGGFPTQLVEPALKKAAAAGVPVIDTHSGDPGPVPPEKEDIVAAQAAHSYSNPGKLMADFIAADSGGDGKVVLIESRELTTSNLVSDAFQKEIDAVCPDCSVDAQNVPVAKWDGIQTQVQSILRSQPDTEYIAPVFDGMALFAVPGIITAGKADDVKVVSFNATPAVMEYLKKGEVVTADVGSAMVLQGWGYADQTVRVLAGEEPLDDIEVPERLFTTDNIGEIDLKAVESTWYTDVDWESAYKTLWGVE